MSRIKLKLKRIDPVKSGIIYGLLMVLISLVILIPMAIVISITGVGANNPSLAIFGGSLAMLIFVPIIYGIIGFVFGLIGTALMNFILGKTNGLDVEFDSDNLEIAQIGKSENELKF